MAQGQEIHHLGTDSTSIEDYYEEWGPQKYEACLKEWGYTAPERVTELIRQYGPTPSEAKLLDAGVGTGLLITPLKDAGYVDATGLDIWQGGLDKAKERGFYKILGKADLQEPLPRITCPDAAFDVVVSVGVLTYINPESCCLHELVRVLKPGGIVCYTNRTDKLDQWAAAEQKLTDEKSWELVERSERIPYLPFNKEFGKDTEIIISTWRKTFEPGLSYMQDKNLLDKKAIPKTWGKPATGPTFNSKYPIEFRKSQIESAGNGAFALVDIPQGTRLRRVAVADGTLVCFCNEQELIMAGWDIDDTVNYGIGHFRDPSSIYFLNPGTAMNHADKTREPSVKYVHDEEGALELWTVKDIKAGEEMFNHYHKDFAPCTWYDELQRSRGNVPLSQLNDHINALYDRV